jgi:Cu(I)/Ag(I) efflux system membrane fusion protein
LTKLPADPSPSSEEPLFWRDAMGGPEISMVAKKDAMGMDFLPVRPAEIAGLLPPLAAETAPLQPAKALAEPLGKRILYYRNPMGLPDISPVPKKDSMGMDYRPVYEGEDADSSVIMLSPGRVQRTGVRAEPVQTRILVSKILVPGSIQLDERRVAVVATRSDAFIEQVADVTTGDLVKKGQTLLRLYSPDIAAAGAQYIENPGLDGSRQRLENLAVPASFYAEMGRTHKVPLVIDWPAPRDGIVLERDAIDGMKAGAGQTLFKIADLLQVWALIDVSEHDYALIKPGQRVTIRARGLPGKSFTGRVGLIYPQINNETRSVPVRVELDNPDLVLRPNMYVDAEIAAEDGEKMITVPDSAVIDTGTREVVILDKGDGHFEPREVKTGRRGEGFVEIRNGVGESDKVVTAANFLIDAESNLKAALKGFSDGGAPQ